MINMHISAYRKVIPYDILIMLIGPAKFLSEWMSSMAEPASCTWTPINMKAASSVIKPTIERIKTSPYIASAISEIMAAHKIISLKYW